MKSFIVQFTWVPMEKSKTRAFMGHTVTIAYAKSRDGVKASLQARFPDIRIRKLQIANTSPATR